MLSDQQLKEIVPSAFTTKNHERSSNKYVRAKTPHLIADLKNLNWHPVKGYQVSPKIAANEGTQKHFIHFRNEESYPLIKNGIHQYVPEIILVNSYDARASCRLLISFYNSQTDHTFVFYNEDKAYTNKVSHWTKNNSKDDTVYQPDAQDFGRLYHKIFQEDLPTQMKFLQQMQDCQFTRAQKYELAHLCCRARWDYKYELPNPQELLKCIHEHSDIDNCWTTFKTIQQ